MTPFEANYTASKNLIAYILRREGIVLALYRDGNGWSILAGHYLGDGSKPPKKINKTIDISIEGALKQAVIDTNERAKIVNTYLKVPIKQEQFDALLTLYYQGGSDGLKAVTDIVNNRDINDPQSVLTSNREALREILQWDTDAAGHHLEGLLKRRGLEVAMYIAGEYGQGKVPYWTKVNPETGKPVMADVEWYDLKLEEIPSE
jgi:lysozyme